MRILGLADLHRLEFDRPAMDEQDRWLARLLDTTSPDVIVIAGDTPREFLGERERERVRLTIDGHPASLRFLDAWFRAHPSRNSA